MGEDAETGCMLGSCQGRVVVVRESLAFLIGLLSRTRKCERTRTFSLASSIPTTPTFCLFSSKRRTVKQLQGLGEGGGGGGQ